MDKDMNRRHRKAFRMACLHNYENRIKAFGKEAEICFGCTDILECSGPISFGVCWALKELVDEGLVTIKGSVPKWARWDIYEGKGVIRHG